MASVVTGNWIEQRLLGRGSVSLSGEEMQSFPIQEFTITFGEESALTRALAAGKEPVLAPTAVALAEAPEAPDQAYRELAAKLGVRSAALREVDLEAVLRDEMIPVYDYAKVKAFLDDQCRRANAGLSWGRLSWSWKPMRKQDRMKHNDQVNNSVYQQAVPYPVLLRVEQIAERLPEAKFFVSEIQEVLDPFLAVTVEGSKRFWVIERWDEPKFRS